MSSDNVFEQVQALIASDERQGLPESVDAILNRIAKLPLAGPIVWAARYESEKQRAENSQLNAHHHVGRVEAHLVRR